MPQAAEKLTKKIQNAAKKDAQAKAKQAAAEGEAAAQQALGAPCSLS